MKKIKNLLFFSIFLLIFTIKVNAGYCDSGHINKMNTGNDKNILCGNWSASVWVCDPTLKQVDDGTFSTADEAYNSCWITRSYEGDKDGTTWTYPLCDTSNVYQYYKCIIRKKKCTTQYKNCLSGKPKTCGNCNCVTNCKCVIDKTFETTSSVGVPPICDSSGGCSSTITALEKYGVSYSIWVCPQTSAKEYLTNGYCEYAYTMKGERGNQIPAYCINPSFNYYHGNTEPVEVDATACESSNSTIDCGYANILIEGNYRNLIATKASQRYSYIIINTALHLWGAHVGELGYDRTGVANYDNVNRDLYDYVVDPILRCPTGCSRNRYTDICTCSENRLLLVARPNTGGAIFDNTSKSTLKYLNNYLFSSVHGKTLNSIYDVDSSVDFDLANANSFGLKGVVCKAGHADANNMMGVFCYYSGYPDMSDDYLKAIVLYLNTIQGNKYMQEHLSEINAKEYETSKEALISNDPTDAYAEVVEDNQVQVVYRLKQGIDIDCNKDDPATQDACVQAQQIKIYNNSTNVLLAQKSVTHYDYCQKNFCYTIIDVPIGTKICDGSDDARVEIITTMLKACGAGSVKKHIPCGTPDTYQTMFTFEPDPNCDTSSITSNETFITYVTCKNCKDSASYKNTICEKDVTDNIVVNYASDPSLNCILHKSSVSTSKTNSKSYYDYSDYFKVNTDICRVYCSDKISFHLAGKTNVYNGLQLKYDIESKVFTNRSETQKSNHALTSIVEFERNCVSKIFYNIPFDYNKDWAKAYALKTDLAKNDWNHLYDAILKKSKDENSREELKNQLIYDLYNCNFFSPEQILDSTKKSDGTSIIHKPNESINGYETAIEKILKEENTASMTIKYDGGAEYINQGTVITRTGDKDGSDPVISSIKRASDDVLNVKYCTSSECFKGIPAADGTYPEDYAAAHESNMGSVAFDTGVNVAIPTNDYAIFTFKSEIDFYNSSVYQTEPYTGRVQLYEETSKDKLISINPYTYPVSLTSYSSTEQEGKCKDGLCSIKHNYIIKPFYRKNDDDDFTRAISNATTYQCYYRTIDDGCKGPLCDDDPSVTKFAYRNIELSNPVSQVRTVTTNWNNENAKDVINEIILSSKNNLYATDEYLEYSFTLDAEAVRSIREYNRDRTYNSGKLTNCEIKDKKYFNCRSTFLSDLLAGVYGDISDPNYNGISKYTREDN